MAFNNHIYPLFDFLETAPLELVHPTCMKIVEASHLTKKSIETCQRNFD